MSGLPGCQRWTARGCRRTCCRRDRRPEYRRTRDEAEINRQFIDAIREMLGLAPIPQTPRMGGDRRRLPKLAREGAS